MIKISYLKERLIAFVFCLFFLSAFFYFGASVFRSLVFLVCPVEVVNARVTSLKTERTSRNGLVGVVTYHYQKNSKSYVGEWAYPGQSIILFDRGSQRVFFPNIKNIYVGADVSVYAVNFFPSFSCIYLEFDWVSICVFSLVLGLFFCMFWRAVFGVFASKEKFFEISEASKKIN